MKGDMKMSALEQIIRTLVADEVVAAERCIREKLSIAPDRTLNVNEAAKYDMLPS